MPNLLKEPSPILIRYKTQLGPKGVSIMRERFMAFAETKCYWWVIPVGVSSWMQESLNKMVNEGKSVPSTYHGYQIRKVAKEAERSYCNADPAKAWHSFQMRQYRREMRLQSQMAQAEKAIEYCKDMRTSPPEFDVCLGQTAFSETLTWDEY